MIRLLLVDANSRASPWFRQRFKLLTKRRPAADPASTPPQKKECRTLRSHHRPVGAKLQPWLQLSPGRVKTPSSSPKSQPVEKTEIQGPLWLKRGIHNVPLRPSPQNGGLALSGVSKSRFRLSVDKLNKVLRLRLDINLLEKKTQRSPSLRMTDLEKETFAEVSHSHPI